MSRQESKTKTGLKCYANYSGLSKRENVIIILQELYTTLEELQIATAIVEEETGKQQRVFLGLKTIKAKIALFEKELRIIDRARKARAIYVIAWLDKRDRLNDDKKKYDEQVEYLEASYNLVKPMLDLGVSLSYKDLQFLDSYSKTIRLAKLHQTIIRHALEKHLTKLRPATKDTREKALEVLKELEIQREIPEYIAEYLENSKLKQLSLEVAKEKIRTGNHQLLNTTFDLSSITPATTNSEAIEDISSDFLPEFPTD